jgi:hypothetical protein
VKIISYKVLLTITSIIIKEKKIGRYLESITGLILIPTGLGTNNSIYGTFCKTKTFK